MAVVPEMSAQPKVAIPLVVAIPPVSGVLQDGAVTLMVVTLAEMVTEKPPTRR